MVVKKQVLELQGNLFSDQLYQETYEKIDQSSPSNKETFLPLRDNGGGKLSLNKHMSF